MVSMFLHEMLIKCCFPWVTFQADLYTAVSEHTWKYFHRAYICFSFCITYWFTINQSAAINRAEPQVFSVNLRDNLFCFNDLYITVMIVLPSIFMAIIWPHIFLSVWKNSIGIWSNFSILQSFTGWEFGFYFWTSNGFILYLSSEKRNAALSTKKGHGQKNLYY